MTRQRALKQLVRDRMARTGESYTTAHRHVVPRATHHRESGLVRRMLSAAGLELSEPMVCGLGGGIGFLYAVFEYDAVDHPLLTIVTQHHPMPWLDAVTSHLGVQPDVATSTRPAKAFDRLGAALDEGRPALIHVARGLLPWHDDVPHAETADPHAVLVTGYDADSYTVVDQDPRQIARDDLEAAWAAHRKGRFGVHTLAEVGSTDIPAATRAAVRTTHRHLTGPVLGHAFDANLGLSGIARLRDDLADTTTKRGWARRFGDGRSFEVGMARLAECLTWAHGSEGATRLAYAAFLTEAGRPEAAATAAKAGHLWSGIADHAAAATDPTVAVPEIAEQVAAVHDVEIALARTLDEQGA